MATFDGLVLRRCLSDRDEILHAGFYWYELAYRINGMSVVCLRTEDTPERSIFFWPIFGWCQLLPRFDARKLETTASEVQEAFLMSHSCSTSSPSGDLVEGSPPVAHTLPRFRVLVKFVLEIPL